VRPRQISQALNSFLAFDTRAGRGKDPKAATERQLAALRDVLDGFRKSFEYVQDYIGIYGLRMWQEEFTRVVAFNTEQESNKYLRVRVLPDASVHQSRTIPIPLMTQVRDTAARHSHQQRRVHAPLPLLLCAGAPGGYEWCADLHGPARRRVHNPV
jgi:hypothetical protein